MIESRELNAMTRKANKQKDLWAGIGASIMGMAIGLVIVYCLLTAMV
jgi:hypothetical protein